MVLIYLRVRLIPRKWFVDESSSALSRQRPWVKELKAAYTLQRTLGLAKRWKWRIRAGLEDRPSFVIIFSLSPSFPSFLFSLDRLCKHGSTVRLRALKLLVSIQWSNLGRSHGRSEACPTFWAALSSYHSLVLDTPWQAATASCLLMLGLPITPTDCSRSLVLSQYRLHLFKRSCSGKRRRWFILLRYC